MSLAHDLDLQKFAVRHNLEGLTEPSLQAIMNGEKGYTEEKARRFLRFQETINEKLLTHEIIINNRYTHWFEQGVQTQEQVRDFVIQFSVFSNLFLVAQLSKMLNADTLESMRASKEILANEIGVVFNSGKKQTSESEDPELVSTEGSIEGGKFHFKAAHFEWLLKMAFKLGLTFDDVGKRKNGSSSTLFFCDELARLYGSEDYMVSQAASYAVENWAAAGFWGELVRGFDLYNQASGNKLPLSFFIWHDKIESQHALHTQEELEELYFTHEIDEDNFILYGNEMLDGVAKFWNGLENNRLDLEQ